MGIYTTLSLKELEDQYKLALESNTSAASLQEYVDEFITRNIDEPYIGQTGIDNTPPLTEELMLLWEIQRLHQSMDSVASDSGKIIPE